MNLLEYARSIVYGKNLEDKLQHYENLNFCTSVGNRNIPLLPGRGKEINFSEKQLKFPKKSGLSRPEGRALALHFFANHELLAIELMAAAILKFFHAENPDSVMMCKNILNTMNDEQRHFKLYQERMRDFGVDFGEFCINDFFWRQISHIDSPAQFFAVVSLGFEAANLDFSLHYRDLFDELGDQESAQIMNNIYLDEITHVAVGGKWLNKWKSDKSLWEYYVENLPGNITPARGKGKHFDFAGRKKANLGEAFINASFNYRDDFKITDRKEWT